MSDNKINMQTMIIAVVISVILSGVISYMILPIVGPQGADGPQGDPGPPGPGFGELIFDSGWLAIEPMSNLEICTLDDPDVFVYMIGRADEVNTHPGAIPVDPDYVYPSYKAHQMYYGGDMWDLKAVASPEDVPVRGASWRIDEDNKLVVRRYAGDFHYEEVRVLVWQLPS